MGEQMTFPQSWEDFLHDYEFEDARRIYTNGSRLIPSFRVKQMMEHYAPAAEIVRCKDCTKRHTCGHRVLVYADQFSDDDFCSKGEREQ